MPGYRGCEASRSKLEKVASTRVCGRLGHGDAIVTTALGGHWASWADTGHGIVDFPHWCFIFPDKAFNTLSMLEPPEWLKLGAV